MKEAFDLGKGQTGVVWLGVGSWELGVGSWELGVRNWESSYLKKRSALKFI
ncbi:hypothetical protein [Flagellimonas maritima]|uniref:hypothetical protein n=1 Tax=Flagellimonas maritima TaxID=1383885 RepID=UPI0013E0C04C|nr:hypothetical protein [Allomuricauda aurantiaca]